MIARDVPRVARVLSRVAVTHQRIPNMVLRADTNQRLTGIDKSAAEIEKLFQITQRVCAVVPGLYGT